MKNQTKWFLISLISLLILSRFVFALPSSPGIIYVSNSSATSGLINRSTDAQGTITTVTLSANQQSYKWKAYVGNVSGKVALADANQLAIYDWNLGTSQGGKVLVSRFSNINWANIACVDQTSINNEETGISMSQSSADNINSTFNYTTHKNFKVGVISINGCRSSATYINGLSQGALTSGSFFQEILLRDTGTGNLVYSTLLESGHNGFDNQQHDFQLLVAENESATAPTAYFFWVELG